MLRLESGARATLSDVTFRDNTVAPREVGGIAAGPVMGLYAGDPTGGSQASAAWFHNCTFGQSTSSVPGEVAVENSNCRVYSNTPLPTVWDRDLRREVGPWRLTPAEGGESSAAAGDVSMFAEGEAAAGLDFLCPSDPLLRNIVADEAAATGLPPAEFPELPDSTTLTIRDPYASTQEDSGSGIFAAQIFGVVVGILVAVIAVLLLVRHRRKRGGGGKHSPATDVYGNNAVPPPPLGLPSPLMTQCGAALGV